MTWTREKTPPSHFYECPNCKHLNLCKKNSFACAGCGMVLQYSSADAKTMGKRGLVRNLIKKKERVDNETIDCGDLPNGTIGVYGNK